MISQRIMGVPRQYKIAAAVIIAVLIAALIYVLVNRTPSLASDYKRGTAYLQPSSAKFQGKRLQFTLPKGFTALPDGSDTTQVFVEPGGKNKPKRMITSLAVLLNTNSKLAETTALSSINKLIPPILSVVYYNKSAPSFQKLDYSPKLLSTVPQIKAQDIGIKQVSQFTMSFTAKAKNTQPAEIDGFIQYKESQGNNYFLIVSSTKDLWSADQGTWKTLTTAMTIK